MCEADPTSIGEQGVGMADDWKRVHVVGGRPEGVEGEMKAVSPEAVERALLEALAAAGQDSVEARWELAQFYKLAGKLELAMQQFRAVLERVTSVEEQAKVLLALGQTAERCGDFELAEQFYREGLALGPQDASTGYFLRNNCGYALNQLGRYADGEALCRQAIEIEPRRANAHKNLGIALEGQGRHREAATAYVAAMQADARDGRAARHLEALLATHPALRGEFGGVLVQYRDAFGRA